MTEYLTDYGKETIRALYFDIAVKMQKLREAHVDTSSYEYQAIQQRKIALDTLFTELITVPSTALPNEDTTAYYDNLAKEHKKPHFNKPYGEEQLTMEGIPKVLELYKDELITTAAAWHDGVFIHLPHTENIADIDPCTVNYNYLERQQGFRIALRALDFNEPLIRLMEDNVRNGVYTLDIDSNGKNRYVELVHYDEKKE